MKNVGMLSFDRFRVKQAQPLIGAGRRSIGPSYFSAYDAISGHGFEPGFFGAFVSWKYKFLQSW